ncbi:FMN-dependent NADH-azoreductase [Pirellulaceae bacterium SH449]
MAKLLYIESSPRKARSKSIEVATAFLDAYKNAHPNDTIQTIDLWSKKLPEFDGYTIDAKYQVMHGQSHDSQQAAAWQVVVDICNEFKAADKYLISLPMWNFGVPYKLKHYIDLIAQPGLTFSFDPSTGYSGLVTGKPVAVVYAQGGSYGTEAMTALDFQTRYLNLLLGFIGFKEITSIVVDNTMGAPDAATAAMQNALDLAKRTAANF